MDEGPLAFAVYFITQTVDLDIDNVSGGIDSHTPDAVQDHRAGDHPASVTHQVLQKRELLRCELQQFTASSRFAANQIEFQVGNPEAYSFGLARRTPPHQVAYTGQQFGEGKRLGEIVIASLLQAATRSSTVRRAERISTGAAWP